MGTGYIGRLDIECASPSQTEISSTASCTRTGLAKELQSISDRIDREHAHAVTTAKSPSAVLDKTAFNMGLNLLDVPRWKKLRITEKYESWVKAGWSDKLFAPDTLAFGLVLGYLVFGDTVQCYDDDITHLVGLGFVSQQRLEERYGWSVDRMAKEAFALHYNGANKPWEASAEERGCETDADDTAVAIHTPSTAV